VPFGEYVPLRRLFGWVTRFTDAATTDRRRGTRLAVLDAGPVAIGPLVCFESAFPDLARSLARKGADLVVVQSATTTFQQSWGPDQHASLAAVRAVESGRPVLQAAISGVSAAFDARGRRLAWYPTSWRGADVIAVPLSRERTPYDRWGDWLPAGCCLVTLAMLAWVALRPRRRLDVGLLGHAARRLRQSARRSWSTGIRTVDVQSGDRARPGRTQRLPSYRRAHRTSAQGICPWHLQFGASASSPAGATPPA